MAEIRHTITGDTSGLQSALKEARGETDKLDGSVEELGAGGKKSFGGIEISAKSAAKAVGIGMVAGVAAAALAVVKLSRTVVGLTADMNDLTKEAKEIGVGVLELDALQGAMDELTKGGFRASRMLQDLQRGLADARDGAGPALDALDKLGISAADLAAMPLPEAVAAIADALPGLRDEAERTQVRMDLLGRSGRALGPAMAEGGGAIRDAMGRARESSTVTVELAAASEGLQDTILHLSRTFQGFKGEALAPLIPVISAVGVKVTEFIGFLSDTGIIQAFATSVAFVAEKLIGLTAEVGEFKEAADLANSAQGSLTDKYNEAFDVVDELRGKLADVTAEQGRLSEEMERAETLGHSTKRLTRELTEAEERRKAALEDLNVAGSMLRSTELLLSLEMGKAARRAAVAAREEERLAAARKAASDELESGGGGAPAAPEPVSLDSAALDAHADAWDGVRAAIDAVARATDMVTDRQLSASERVIKAKKAEDAAIVQLVNDAVSNTLIGEDQKRKIIEDGNAARIALAQELADSLDAIQQQTLDDELQRIAEEKQARVEGAAATLEIAASVAGSIASIFTTLQNDRMAAAATTAEEIESIEAKLAESTDSVQSAQLDRELARKREELKAQGEAAKEAFGIAKAVAIAQAVVSTALAIVNALATPGVPFPVAAGFAIAAGIAGAASIVAIAAAPAPSFARGTGRVSPAAADMHGFVSARLHPNEAVVTEQGVRGLGGSGAIDAANRGMGGGGGGGFTGVLLFDDGSMRTATHETLRTGSGSLVEAIRTTPVRSMGHRVPAHMMAS